MIFIEKNPDTSWIPTYVWSSISKYVEKSTKLPNESEVVAQLSTWGIGYDLLTKIYIFL